MEWSASCSYRFTSSKNLKYPLDRRLSEICGEERELLILPRIGPSSLSFPAQSLVTVTTAFPHKLVQSQNVFGQFLNNVETLVVVNDLPGLVH